MRFILLAVLLLAGGQAVANYSGIVWPEEEGITPLMEACRAGDCDRVRKLLAAKPDLERATWVYHRTVWDYAARSKRSYEVMTLLLEHGGRAPKSLELLEQRIPAARPRDAAGFPANVSGGGQIRRNSDAD